jgi:hypothetical protein
MTSNCPLAHVARALNAFRVETVTTLFSPVVFLHRQRRLNEWDAFPECVFHFIVLILITSLHKAVEILRP